MNLGEDSAAEHANIENRKIDEPNEFFRDTEVVEL